MKSTDQFKKTVKDELDLRAFKNPLFAKDYKNPDKNIDDCIKYILGAVKASGSNGFTDDEVYGMAVHYYSEDDVKIGNVTSAQVVVNHVVHLTEKEKEKLREKARQAVINEEKARMRGTNKKSTTKAEPKSKQENTLF